MPTFLILKETQGKVGPEVIPILIVAVIVKKDSACLSPQMISDQGQRTKRLTLFISTRMDSLLLVVIEERFSFGSLILVLSKDNNQNVSLRWDHLRSI